MARATGWASGCHENTADYEELRLLQCRRRLPPEKGGGGVGGDRLGGGRRVGHGRGCGYGQGAA